jgi:Yip1 domain
MKLVERVTAILLTPGAEWRVIARESDRPTELLVNYVAWLAAIPAVADFIGMTLIGFTLPIGAVARVGIIPALLILVFDYASAFVVIAALAAIISLSAPVFGATRNMTSAFKLAVYAYTPTWLAGIFLLVPGLHFLIMLGFYGLFLLFKGVPVLMRTPAENTFLFAGAITVCAIVIVLIIGVARAMIFSLPGIL